SQRRLHRIDSANTHLSFFPISLLGHYEFCDHEVVSGTKDNTVNYEITRLFRDERQSVNLPRSKSYAPVEVMIDGKALSLDFVEVKDNNIHSVSFLNLNLWPWIAWCPVGLASFDTVPILNDEAEALRAGTRFGCVERG